MGWLFGGDDRDRESPRADRSLFGLGRRVQNHARNADADPIASALGLGRAAREQRTTRPKQTRNQRNNRREY